MIPTKEELEAAMIARHGEILQKTFAAATVAVCGLGGMGSNVAISLARAGIGKLILIDYDYVDVTNLHRQQYKAKQVGRAKTDAMAENLKEIAPYVEIETHMVEISEKNALELLTGAEVICEALDQAEAKAMLTNLVLTKMPDKYLVASSGMAGMASANKIQTRRVTSRFYLCGDGESDVENTSSLVAARVAACAAHEALMVLRILSGEKEP